MIPFNKLAEFPDEFRPDPEIKRQVDEACRLLEDGLVAQREGIAFDFLASGAFPRDLWMEIGPVRMRTEGMLVWYEQDVRFV